MQQSFNTPINSFMNTPIMWDLEEVLSLCVKMDLFNCKLSHVLDDIHGRKSVFGISPNASNASNTSKHSGLIKTCRHAFEETLVLFTSRVDARAPVRSERSTLVTIQLLLVSPGRVDHLIEETWLTTQVWTTLDRLTSVLSGSPIPDNHRTYTFISPFLQKEEMSILFLQLVSGRCWPR
jgi:hypothetical protein